MSQRFIRCPHCGLPHALEEGSCPITGRPLDAKRSARAPESDSMRKLVVGTPQRHNSASSPPPHAAPASVPAMMVASAHPSQQQQGSPFETSPPNATLLGQVMGGKYRALRILGEGGMGAVYECEHVALHRKVAVKVLHPAQARKKASVQRFHHEAQVAGAIGHPNICEIYDMGELEDGSPFLVMELLMGETLADRIASEGALPFDDVIEIIAQVLSGLIAAHDKGIIHRDIKPENIFLTNRPGIAPLAKILDFGISKVAGGEELNLTRTGMVMGTPFYMSPEQARGDRTLDQRVDIYATGVMTYECLTGRRPFTAANYNALLVQILTTNPRPPHEIRPAITEGFEDIVSRAMHRNRENRFRNAAEMQKALVALRDPVAPRRIVHGSIPPEPISLMVPKSRPGDASSARGREHRGNEPQRRGGKELPAVSVNIEGRDLLEGDTGSGSQPLEDSGSIEIPIVDDGPPSAQHEAPRRPHSPMSAPQPAHKPMYRAPEPQRAPQPPRPQPIAAKFPAQPPRTFAGPGPRAAPQQPPRAAATPPVRRPSIPPPVPSSRKSRMITPTPTPVDPRLLGDAPWLVEHALEGDPTEIGTIPTDHDDHTEIGPMPGMRHPNDTPIDADSTERIEPPRMQRMAATRRGRNLREVNAPVVHDPRREDDLPTRAGQLHLPSDEPSYPDDEAPTTLFDRRSLKPSSASGIAAGSSVLRHTTERAPAQPTAPEPKGPKPPAIPRAPRRGP